MHKTSTPARMSAPTGLAALALGASLAACAPVGSDLQQLPPSTAGLALGQRGYADGPIVTPIALIEDSRCPANVVCVWAGRVIVRVKVETGPSPVMLDLTLNEPKPVADGTITLTGVTPHPKTGEATAPERYRFKLTFAGGL